jgi:hypothetical protein
MTHYQRAGDIANAAAIAKELAPYEAPRLLSQQVSVQGELAAIKAMSTEEIEAEIAALQGRRAQFEASQAEQRARLNGDNGVHRWAGSNAPGRWLST